MNNTASLPTVQEQETEDSPLVRGAYALGVAALAASAALPHSEKWAACGIALIVFSYMF